jgi:mRNA-degrading endonuclease toxin of MazEF toxin-antitoxin module
MSKIVTTEDVKINFANAVNELSDFYKNMPETDDGRKLTSNYYEWTAKKTKIISSEKSFVYPADFVPSVITKYIYDYLYTDKQKVINLYYKLDEPSQKYVLNAKRSVFKQEHIDIIVNDCVLRRGHVIWVEFGCNIDCEFGGKHPAIILKNCKQSLIVVPLSSQEPNNEDINVKVDTVYNFEIKTRWANILRIMPISIQRIDFNSRVGSVHNKVVKAISERIQEHGIK